MAEEYKSLRVSVETKDRAERLQKRLQLRFYNEHPEGVMTNAGKVTMNGLVNMAFELLERQMDKEDGLETHADRG